MRKITVDFSLQTYPLFAGYVGEHNATELTAIKPADLEGVTYSLAFMTNGEVIHSEFFGVDEEIKVTLWQQLTLDNDLYVQLEAYDENGKYLGKSGMIKLILSNSVHGMDIIADADNPDVYSEIAQNSAFRERLESNADTLNKLSTSEKGELLFDGEKIGGQVLASDVFYENLDLFDQTNTVEAALNETIDFIFQKLPEIYVEKKEVDSVIDEALTGAKESGDFNGKDGKSAYQYAVDGGFEGTEEEFGSLLANVGSSETTKRPTAEYVYDFMNDERGCMYSTEENPNSLFIFVEEANDEERAMVGKEIADVEFERSSGEWVSIKNMSEIDFKPYISLLNHIVTSSFEDMDTIVFVSVYYPSTKGWWNDEVTTQSLSKMRITYYTD